MKTYGGVKVQFHAHVTTIPDSG